MDVFEAMNSCTAMRYFQEKPITKDEIEKLIPAATRASNPGNSQGWEFLVIDDLEVKGVVGDKVMAGMRPFFENRARPLHAFL